MSSDCSFCFQKRESTEVGQLNYTKASSVLSFVDVLADVLGFSKFLAGGTFCCDVCFTEFCNVFKHKENIVENLRLKEVVLKTVKDFLSDSVEDVSVMRSLGSLVLVPKSRLKYMSGVLNPINSELVATSVKNAHEINNETTKEQQIASSTGTSTDSKRIDCVPIDNLIRKDLKTIVEGVPIEGNNKLKPGRKRAIPKQKRAIPKQKRIVDIESSSGEEEPVKKRGRKPKETHDVREAALRQVIAAMKVGDKFHCNVCSKVLGSFGGMRYHLDKVHSWFDE